MPQRDTVMRSIPAHNGFREASKTRSASIYDGERTQKYVTPRKAERDTVMRSICKGKRSNYNVETNYIKPGRLALPNLPIFSL